MGLTVIAHRDEASKALGGHGSKRVRVCLCVCLIQVFVPECIIEDLDASGNPRPINSPPTNASDKANMVIRIRHKVRQE